MAFVHSHTNTRTRVTGGGFSLKWAISSAECNICILMQGGTGREGTADQEPWNTYQGFTQSECKHTSVSWRNSRIRLTPTSVALGNSWNTTQLTNSITIQLRSSPGLSVLVSCTSVHMLLLCEFPPTYLGQRVFLLSRL